MLFGSCFFGTRVRTLTCSRHQPLYPSALFLAFAEDLTGTPPDTCVTDTCSGWQDSNLRPRLGAGILTSVLRPQNMKRVEGLSPSVLTESAFGCVLRLLPHYPELRRLLASLHPRADDGNRTRDFGLGSRCIAVILHPLIFKSRRSDLNR